MKLAGVRRQLAEAKESLLEAAARGGEGAYDPAYRAGLKSRNLFFHATRGLAAARGEALPEMPVVGAAGGGLADHQAAVAALDAALAVDDDAAMGVHFDAARAPYARFLGWLRDEVGRAMSAAPAKG